MIKRILNYFTKTEIALWCTSTVLIIASFICFDRGSYLTLTASLIGVTSLIFNAKGNPAGQLLMVVFSLLYAAISYEFTYYGEMITYLGMTAPMAVLAFIMWLKNPYKGKKSEVAVNHLKIKEIIFMLALTALVTFVFYFILAHFNTANIVPSIVSVATSFAAVYLTFRRSAYYAVAYAANDAVLIILWTLAAFDNIAYISVIICFVVFLINDLYGFISWKKMQKRQHNRY